MFRGCVLGPGAQMKQNHTSSTVSLPQAPPGRIHELSLCPLTLRGRAETARCSLEVSIMKADSTHIHAPVYGAGADTCKDHAASQQHLWI